MRLCVGTSKGIVILDRAHGAVPSMVLADPCSIFCMAQDGIDPNILYAGSVHHPQTGARSKVALARSLDGGRNWADITPGMARDEDVWAVATPPDGKDEVFIGTSHARILRSEDRGHTFRECTSFLKMPGRDRWSFPPPPHIPHVRSLTFDPQNSSIMYAGVEEGGVFRSPDRGESFEPLNQGIYDDVHTVAVDPTNPTRLYATTGRGFYLSTDAGRSWRYIKGLSRSYTVPLLVDSDAIFTAAAAGPPPTWSIGPAGADAMVFRSTDHGKSFEAWPMHDGGTYPERGMIMKLRDDPEVEGALLGVTNDGSVIRIDESGNHSVIAEKLPPAYDLVALP